MNTEREIVGSPPSSGYGLTTESRLGWVLLVMVVVLLFFGGLAIWGVAAATIVAVSAAVVAVLRVVLARS